MSYVESMHAAEAQIILQIQTFLGLGLRIPMTIVSLFASEAFVIAIVPIVYWCVNRKKGAELGLLVLVSTFINLWLKQIFGWPRPFDIIPSVGLASETSYGMPSGHSQLSVVFAAYIIQFLPKKWRPLMLIGFPLLIGFSRIYLGVHFLTDVLGGYLAGSLFFILYKLGGPSIEKILQKADVRGRVILAAALSFVMNLILPKETMISGAFFGAAIGFTFAARSLAFNEKDRLKIKISRYLVGLTTTGIVYVLLKSASGPINNLLGNNQENLLRFLRYALVGGWVSFGVPFLFLKVGLAHRTSV
ncbi:MAG TPA: phosphatase PAP2 family protein [Rectinema sp.]|nr:phosphatase PAP2 family protein [Rectinema sp.]